MRPRIVRLEDILLLRHPIGQLYGDHILGKKGFRENSARLEQRQRPSITLQANRDKSYRRCVDAGTEIIGWIGRRHPGDHKSPTLSPFNNPSAAEKSPGSKARQPLL